MTSGLPGRMRPVSSMWRTVRVRKSKARDHRWDNCESSGLCESLAKSMRQGLILLITDVMEQANCLVALVSACLSLSFKANVDDLWESPTVWRSSVNCCRGSRRAFTVNRDACRHTPTVCRAAKTLKPPISLWLLKGRTLCFHWLISSTSTASNATHCKARSYLTLEE